MERYFLFDWKEWWRLAPIHVEIYALNAIWRFTRT